MFILESANVADFEISSLGGGGVYRKITSSVAKLLTKEGGHVGCLQKETNLKFL